MVEVKVGIRRIEAESVSKHQTKFDRYTDDGFERTITTYVRVKAPDVDLRELIAEEVARQNAEDYAPDPPRIDIRSYSDDTIGRQDPFGHYEEWEFNGDHLVTFSSVSDNERQ